VYLVLDTLLQITMRVTLGTRLCLVQALFTLMSGQLLESRGAIIPALFNLGFDQRETQRIRQAIHRGAWSTNQLLKHFYALVVHQQHWQPLRIAGYTVNALDTTAIFRPKLQGCQTRHYHPMAGRCLPSTNFALLGSIGSIQDQNVTLLRCITRGDEGANTEEALMRRIAVQAARVLEHDETAITVADRKFNALELLESGHSLLVLRRARNMTFRRASFTANTGRGRPVKHGEIIRPLERVFKGKTLLASSADQECTWVELDKDGQELVLHASIWVGLVFFEQKSWSVERLALNKSSLWTVMTVKHPSFELPMLIALNVPGLTPVEACRAVKARWGIEQAPQARQQPC
jgi:hypothetical protein